MKVLTTTGLTKLIQLIKSSFISSSDVETTSEVTLATVATTGAYSDLSGTPIIPTVDQTYDGTSANAQSGVAVASAISGKADDSAVVHLAGTETITGTKTFNAVAYGKASDAVNSIVTTVNKSKAANGYFQLGNGMIINWGTQTHSSAAINVTFAKAFTSTNYAVTAILNTSSASTTERYCPIVYSKSKTGCTIWIKGTEGNISWHAIGY